MKRGQNLFFLKFFQHVLLILLTGVLLGAGPPPPPEAPPEVPAETQSPPESGVIAGTLPGWGVLPKDWQERDPLALSGFLYFRRGGAGGSLSESDRQKVCDHVWAQYFSDSKYLDEQAPARLLRLVSVWYGHLEPGRQTVLREMVERRLVHDEAVFLGLGPREAMRLSTLVSLGEEGMSRDALMERYLAQSESWRQASVRELLSMERWLRPRLEVIAADSPLFRVHEQLSSHLSDQVIDSLEDDAPFGEAHLLTFWRALPQEQQAVLRNQLVDRWNVEGQRFKSLDWSGLMRLRSRALGLGVSGEVVNRWLSQWFAGHTSWSKADVGALAEMMAMANTAEESRSSGSASREVFDLLWKPTLHRLAHDPSFLAQAIRVGLPGQVLGRLNDDQRVALRHALVAGLKDRYGLWQDVQMVSLVRLEQVAGQLRVPREVIASWRSDWITSGEGWQSSDSYALGIMLYSMLNAETVIDWRRARVRLLDHLLVQARENPSSLDPARWKGYARFVVTLWASLSMDGRDTKSQAMATVLNAMPFWPGYGPLPSPRHAPGARAYRVMWYGVFEKPSCNGGLSWGQGHHGDESQALAHWMQSRLLDGVLVPHPATLALMAWHHQGMGTLDGWADLCDRQIASHAPGSKEHLGWLLGRAYVAELSAINTSGGQEPDPLLAELWLERALAQATDDATRVEIVTQLALKRAMSGATDTAAALVVTWRESLHNEPSAVVRLGAVSQAIEALAQEFEAKHSITP